MKETKRDGLILKPADSADMELLFRWVNDDRVRENAFHKEKISFEENQKWFFDLLRDKRQNQYILYQDREPVGQIRLYICGGVAEIDYSIAPEKREQGYGRMLIGMIQNKIRDEFPETKKLVAKVRPSNMASICCFEKNGFCEVYRQYEFDIANG